MLKSTCVRPKEAFATRSDCGCEGGKKWFLQLAHRHSQTWLLTCHCLVCSGEDAGCRQLAVGSWLYHVLVQSSASDYTCFEALLGPLVSSTQRAWVQHASQHHQLAYFCSENRIGQQVNYSLFNCRKCRLRYGVNPPPTPDKTRKRP